MYFIRQISSTYVVTRDSSDHLADLTVRRDNYGLCITNCAQCKRVYAGSFEGQMCADDCYQTRGHPIPDCEVIDSIRKYLN